jgi:hypothetical protein
MNAHHPSPSHQIHRLPASNPEHEHTVSPDEDLPIEAPDVEVPLELERPARKPPPRHPKAGASARRHPS